MFKFKLMKYIIKFFFLEGIKIVGCIINNDVRGKKRISFKIINDSIFGYFEV